MTSESLFTFLIESQRRMTFLKEKRFPIEKLRSLAESQVDNCREGYLGDVLPPGRCSLLPERVFDDDLARLMVPLDIHAHSDNEWFSACGSLFLAPSEVLLEHLDLSRESVVDPSFPPWLVELKKTRNSCYQLRSGFLTLPYEVLEASVLGFDGVIIHAGVLDLYEIQYLIELCRDLKMSAVAMVDGHSTLTRVLSTDAPYLGIWARDAATLRILPHLHVELGCKVPAACLRFGLATGGREKVIKSMGSMGFRGAFCTVAGTSNRGLLS